MPCCVMMKKQADTEDIFQTVFLKYILSSVVFANEAHEKAWFIRVTINACKDLLKSFFRRHMVPLAEAIPAEIPQERRDVLQAVLDLRFLDYETAVDRILADDTVAALLAQDGLLMITVSGEDAAQCGRMLRRAGAAAAAGMATTQDDSPAGSRGATAAIFARRP